MNEPRRMFLTLCAVLLAAVGALLWWTAQASAGANNATLYVAPPPAGNDSNPCSLGQPCATVQHAVDVAGSGGEILVATGFYTGVQARGAMTQVVYISKTVSIQGGYSTDFGTWDPSAYPTTLDAEGEGRVVSIAGLGIQPTLDSLVITGGDATGLTTDCPPAGGTSDGCGGGVLVHRAEAIIVRNVISGNLAAVSEGSHSASGGGLCLAWAAGTVVSDNLITGNYASQGKRGMGGGIHLYYPYDVQVLSNRLLDNVATTDASLGGWGGGIAAGGSGAAVTISGNLIVGNRTNAGNTGWGAGIYHWYGTGWVTGNDVTGNHGASAIYMGGYEGLRLEANQVISNSTGVGIQLLNGGRRAPALVNNIVARSGDVSIGAQAHSGSPLTLTLLHNTLAGEGSGYGIYVDTGYVTLVLTNTIVAGHGWGITNPVPAGSTVVATRTLFWDNGQDGLTGANPLFGDPAFANPEAGDYHLGVRSAAIDAAVEAGVDRDVDGDGRPIGPAPDIGADEAWLRIFLPLIVRSD